MEGMGKKNRVFPKTFLRSAECELKSNSEFRNPNSEFRMKGGLGDEK